MNLADRFFQILPPTVGGEHGVISTSTSAAAANWNWITALGSNAPKGTVFLILEALSQDVYVTFKPTATTAATTTSTGLLVKAGQPGRPWLVGPDLPVIDHIAAGAGTLKLQVASKISARQTV